MLHFIYDLKDNNYLHDKIHATSPAEVEALDSGQHIAWRRCGVEVCPEVVHVEVRELAVDEGRERSCAAIWIPHTVGARTRVLTSEATQVAIVGTRIGDVSLKDIDGRLEKQRESKERLTHDMLE